MCGFYGTDSVKKYAGYRSTLQLSNGTYDSINMPVPEGQYNSELIESPIAYLALHIDDKVTSQNVTLGGEPDFTKDIEASKEDYKNV